MKAAKLRPGTSDEAVYYKSATTPVSSRRPLSAHSVGDKGHLNSAAASSFVRPALDGGDDARSVDSRGSRTGSRQSKRSERTALGSAADALVSSKAYAKDTQLLISANGQEVLQFASTVFATLIDEFLQINATVRRPGRSQIMKSHSMREGSTSGLLPMRFKTELPSTFSSVDTHRNYMQLSDSDDDDKDEMDPRDIKLMAVGAKPPNKKKGGTNANKGKIEILFKRDRPVTRERPQSAKQFRTVSMNDPEFKVLLFGSTYS